MSLPRLTGPLRSIATWWEFQPHKSRRGRDEERELQSLRTCACSPSNAALKFRSHDGTGSARSENYCPGRAILGSGKNDKHPASKSAQAAPSDMPLATSL